MSADGAEVAPAPLLEARGARIAVDDVVAIGELTCMTRGDRVLCAGDEQALLAALLGVPLSTRGQPSSDEVDEPEGIARVTAGSLLLAGRDVARGAHRAIAGGAPLDPPLPASWTAEAYAAWSARLSGAPARAARDLGTAALAKVGLGPARRRAVGTLALPERRALILAAAVALSPAALVLEDPLAGLDGNAAAFVLGAVAAATEGRRALISVGRLDLSGPGGALVRGASDLLVLSAGELVFAGTPAELDQGIRIYALTVRTQAEALREALARRGLTLKGLGGEVGSPTRFSVALPEGVSTREIVGAAAEARAAVVEMVPLI